MTMILNKKRSSVVRVPGSTVRTKTIPLNIAGHKSVKYVELYDNINAIAANLTSNLLTYTVPDGHCAELYALGVMPDFDPLLVESNLLDVTIATNNKDHGLNFLCNHMGMNSLPYGDRISKQPIRMLDFPMRRGNLTPKFNEGVEIEIKGTATATAVDDTIRVRAKILLYEAADVAAIYGSSLSKFATLPGGIDQFQPQRLFAEYVRLAAATGGDNRWVDLYSLSVKDYEHITLSHIGIIPHANADSLKIYDHRLKWEAPEYEPYYKVNEDFNALPFGDDDDEQPTQKLPSIVAGHVFTNTTLKLQTRDNGAIVPINGIAAQLFGKYRRVR